MFYTVYYVDGEIVSIVPTDINFLTNYNFELIRQQENVELKPIDEIDPCIMEETCDVNNHIIITEETCDELPF